MREKLTHAIEDYLKTIYEITTVEERAGTNQIAAILEVTSASVTGMLKKLSETNPPLVVYQKYKGAVLTPEGEKIALEIMRHHRLLELFLHQILGYEWDEVHTEADRLEHVISEEFEERIAEALGNPRHDPHGDPIPTRELRMPPSPTTRLSDLRAGQKAVVQRARDTDPDLLRHLGELGLVPAAKVSVIGYSPFDHLTRIRVAGQDEELVLGPRITEQVFVEVKS